MSQQQLLKRVSEALDRTGIGYIVSGSMVSSLQGEPRSTHDIDIVIDIPEATAHELVKAFPAPDYYLDEDSVLEAIKRRSMFNLIDANTGEKVDFWILTDEPFDESRFARKTLVQAFDLWLPVTSPEDTILAKLRWAKLSGGSEKQFKDALRVYEVQFEKLDMEYLRGWADRLGVSELLQRLIQEAEVI